MQSFLIAKMVKCSFWLLVRDSQDMVRSECSWSGLARTWSGQSAVGQVRVQLIRPWPGLAKMGFVLVRA